MKDVRDIAIQMLSRLETIHGEGLLWLDVKPQNMAYGRKGTRAQDILYSLDFGFMMPYMANGRHVRQKITGDKFGTLRYMSRNMHRGKTPSRRDDMESLCYVLVYLAKRRLPWQGKVEDDGERAVTT
ncbi:kinase-like domain-containing protein [Paraphysoderma sedebokerense]|nr:kinase-like domain-containing protein [Paraphysoderma sedebokerense]KAI9138899.1 kinase-like domain-containing protein [Paraphysoderma sedebokerense]